MLSGFVGNGYSVDFKSVTIPSDLNAYFMFFKLGVTSEPVNIAVDNFIIESSVCAEVNNFIPTSDELMAENGVVWDQVEKGCVIGNGETVILDKIDNETAKNGMKARNDIFKTNVVELQNADGHLFSGFTKDNLVAGKKLVLDINYYNVNDGGICLIMMGAGNPTLQTTITNDEKDANVKTIHLEYVLLAGQTQLNIYGANNPNFNIYVGEISAKLVEPDPIPEGTTTNGFAAGDKITQYGRQFGNESKGGMVLSEYDNNQEAIKGEGMGEKPTKFSLTSGGNATMEWFQPRKNGAIFIENTHKYQIKLALYVEEVTDSRVMYNFDNAEFIDLGALNVGYNMITIDWTANKNVDYFSLYFPDTFTKGSMYVGELSVELVEVVK